MDTIKSHELGAVVGAEMSSIEDMLADLAIGETIETNAVEAINEMPVIEEIVEEGIHQELGADLARSDIYENQTDATVTDTAAPAVVAAVVEKKERKAKAASAPKAPKMERDLSALPDEAFVLEVGGVSEKADVLPKRPSQKKIAEKFDQTIAALHAGRKPSTFVIDLHKVLAGDPTKMFTTKELIAALKVEGYSDGTAASQVGQIMSLFAVLKIADRIGQTLRLYANSAYGAKIAAL